MKIQPFPFYLLQAYASKPRCPFTSATSHKEKEKKRQKEPDADTEKEKERESFNVLCHHHLPPLMKSLHVPPTEFPILHSALEQTLIQPPNLIPNVKDLINSFH